MNAVTAKRRIDELEQVLGRLEEALTVPESAPLAIDGTIQRFEFVFELCWKAMKALAELNSPAIDAGSARAAIKASYTAGWIDDEAGWLDLLEMRNATSHTYREAMAKDIYRRIGIRTPMIRSTLPKLRAQLP
jgi:nucleotidyltransferase substrate binding protein (TIGR01987 family)